MSRMWLENYPSTLGSLLPLILAFPSQRIYSGWRRGGHARGQAPEELFTLLSMFAMCTGAALCSHSVGRPFPGTCLEAAGFCVSALPPIDTAPTEDPGGTFHPSLVT